MVACPSCGKENPAGFTFCGFCAAPLASTLAEPVVQERKVVSVLFCDLAGFTAASESADPETVQARLAPYHTRARERIEAFGGTVEKFIGDAVMAVFGAPVAHEDDAERAVRAGLAVLESIGELNAGDPALALSVRIGVNTGEAVVSLRARPEQGEGMVTGDVVNTAARIQSQAPINGVAVGEGTFRATARVFVYEPLDAIAAKGKSGLVPVWRAVAPTARFGTDVMRSMATPFIGRSVDLALVCGTFDKVVEERSVQLVTVIGEPGVGKSRLVAELGAYADRLDVLVTWRQGRCPPYGEGITFWALGEIVKAHAGVYESDSPETATEKLDAVLPEGADRPWLRARLLPLFGIESDETVSQEEAFSAWRRFLEGIAERDPTVLVFEDIHWADEAMLAFLAHLADWAEGVPLLVVCTARPELYERHESWGAATLGATTIALTRLSDADIVRLVSALLERSVLPVETQQLLLERAGGNPLYAEEFVRMLRDRGLLDEHGTLKADAEVPFPDSIQALIAARLDTLPPVRKALLQDASVIGKVFWAGSLAAMGQRDGHEVEVALHELARKELVKPVRQSSMQDEAEYAFQHLLARDVAYGQIPRAQRAAKHISAASWLEGKAAERVEDAAEVLAYHTGEALALARASGDRRLELEVIPAATRYALLAGERALGLDTTKALALFELARGLTTASDPVFPLVLLRWADAARQAGRLREAAETLEQARVAFQAHGDVVRAGEALTTLSNVSWSLGDPMANQLGMVEQAVALLELHPGPELIASLAELAGAQLVAGARDRGIASAERALRLAEQLQLPRSGRALGFLGFGLCARGDLDGLDDIEQALALLDAEGKGRDGAVLRFNLANVRWFLEGPAAAIAALELTQAFARGPGVTSIAHASAALGVTMLLELGRLEEALQQAHGLLPPLRESGDRFSLLNLRAGQTRALLERGGDALEAGEDAVQMARDAEDSILLTVAASGAALALIAAGQTRTARSLLDEVADGDAHSDPAYALALPSLARAAAALGEHALTARLLGGVPEALPCQQHALATAQAIEAELAGAPAEAADLYAVAAEHWRQFTNMLEHAHALLGRGRCLAALGDPRADGALDEARAPFDLMGAHAQVAACNTLIATATRISS